MIRASSLRRVTAILGQFSTLNVSFIHKPSRASPMQIHSFCSQRWMPSTICTERSPSAVSGCVPGSGSTARENDAAESNRTSSVRREGMTEDQSAAHHFSIALFGWSAGGLASHVAPREASNSFRGVCSIMEQAQGVGRCALSLWPPRTAVLHERRSYQRSQLSIFAASFSGPTTAMPSRPSFRHSPATACTSARVTAMMRCSISTGHSTRP